MLSQELTQLADTFQKSIPGLDENIDDYCKCHDAIHQLTGLGVSDKEESLVLMVESILAGDSLPDKYLDAVEALIAKIPTHLIIELSNFLTPENA